MTINKHHLSLFLLFVCGVLLCVPLGDNVGAQLTKMLGVTLSVYAILRGLNAVISTAQGTEVSIEPMGVGVTLTPGEILDPLNDLVEQVSTVLLFASASIGVQKIILNLTDIAFLRWSLLAAVVIIGILVASQRISVLRQQTLIRLVVLLTILRLMVPVMVLSSSLMQSWLEQDRQTSVSTLVVAQDDIENLNKTASENEQSGWFESISNTFKLDEIFSSMENKANEAVSAAVYILAEFVLVFILIPVLFMFVGYRLLFRQLSKK